MKRLFVTSDDHFYHKNIIKYCNRPWNHGLDEEDEMIVTDQDVLNMNYDLIENWNSVVNKNDIVINLGDFCLGGKKLLQERVTTILRKLNGEKYLLLGNHDLYDIDFYKNCGFRKVYDKPILWDDNFMFSHRPLVTRWSNRDWILNAPFINVFGHVHNSPYDIVNDLKIPLEHVTLKTYCCCVELTDYKPVLLSDVLTITSKKKQ